MGTYRATSMFTCTRTKTWLLDKCTLTRTCKIIRFDIFKMFILLSMYIKQTVKQFQFMNLTKPKAQ